MLKTRKIGMTRLAKILYLLFAVVIMCNLFATAVAAANVSDTRHQDIGKFVNGSMTEFRRKEDATSCYVYNDRSSCAVAVRVYGSNYSNGTGKVDDSYYPYGVAVTIGTKKSIANLVNERGRTYAALQFWTPDSRVYEAIDLLWSPDSTRNYG